MNVCDNLGDHLVGNVYIKVHVDANSPCILCDNDESGNLVYHGTLAKLVLMHCEPHFFWY